MVKLHRRLLFAMLAALPFVCWTGSAGAASFMKSTCWFTIPADREMSCGHLLVPESRSKPASHSISLAVAIFEPDKVRHDPVVFLSGGPGQPAGIGTENEIVEWWQFINGQDWLRGRRLVVLDQRGVGLSKPALDCPVSLGSVQQESAVAQAATDPTPEAARKSSIVACRQAFVDRGIDLSAYNTWESAEDVEDLRTSLGIRRWVLYGVSYGTEVAMAVLERHSAGVGAAILDSVLPPKTSYLSQDGVNLARAVSILDIDCRNDAHCHRGSTPLGDMVERTASRLNAAPVPLWLGRKHPGYLHLTGDGYLEFLFNAFYDSEMLPVLPSIIRRTYEQDYRLIAPLLADPAEDRRDKIFDGLDYSITCAEAGSFEIDAATPAYMRKWAMETDYSMVCPLWLAAKDPSPSVPPGRSDVPVLFLSGEYDPATPPRWAQSAARDFPRGQSIVFRGIGHDVLDSDLCGSEVVADFLKSPETAVHSSCLADLKAPDFIAADDDIWATRSAAALADVEEQAMAKRARNIDHEMREGSGRRSAASVR